jgi:hypothetical protein
MKVLVAERVGVIVPVRVVVEDDVAEPVGALEPVGDGLGVAPTHNGLTPLASGQKASWYQSRVAPLHCGEASPGPSIHVEVRFTP